MDRTNLSSESKWEDIVGYSRAVRLGNVIEVSGTVATDENGKVVGGISVYEQTKYILSKIIAFVEKAGGTREQIIRTRIYVTDISAWEEIGKAHGEIFREIKPATSMIEVCGLISEEYLVEIEATAIVG